MTADYYLNATLKAKVDGIKVYSGANSGSVIRTCSKGSIVGEIFSYVMVGSDVWWDLKEGGFVKHGTGLFDATLAQTTSEGYDDQTVKNAQSAFPDFFGGIPSFASLEKGGMVLLGLVVLFMLYKIFK